MGRRESRQGRDGPRRLRPQARAVGSRDLASHPRSPTALDLCAETAVGGASVSPEQVVVGVVYGQHVPEESVAPPEPAAVAAPPEPAAVAAAPALDADDAALLAAES